MTLSIHNWSLVGTKKQIIFTLRHNKHKDFVSVKHWWTIKYLYKYAMINQMDWNVRVMHSFQVDWDDVSFLY